MGKLKINKEIGKGTTRHKNPITEEDLHTLRKYFKKNMAGPPNAYLLQEIVLFNIIFLHGTSQERELVEYDKRHFMRV